MEKIFDKSALASILISIGCCIYLCSPDRYIGAFLFSIALLTICYMNLNLYTGKIGYLNKGNAKEIFLTLFVNIVYAIALGLLIYGTLINNQSALDKASTLCVQKLNQHWLETFCKSFFCGVLMYVAVEIYKKKNSPLGILLGIPTFILCGFEHSIADTVYFVIARNITPKTPLFLLICIFGNSLGSLFTRVISKEDD